MNPLFESLKFMLSKNRIKTEAEIDGGGYEWSVGWQKRENWNYKTPYGKKPLSDLETVTNISRFEAEKYYSFINGRLPIYVEWALAAYTQLFNKDNFKKVTYIYPSGNFPKNMNAQELLEYNKHVKVILLPEGINGLVAMAKMFGNGLMINVNKAL